MTARMPSSCGPLAAQSRERAGAVFLAGQDDQRHLLVLILHRGVEDRHRRAVGQMAGDAAFGAGGELVLQADVGEGAADHDLVVAAPRAVGVEVRRLRRRARSGTCPAGLCVLIEPAGEMWSVVMLSPSRASTRAPLMSCDRRRPWLHVLEVRRMLDVGGVRIPGEQIARRHRHAAASGRRPGRPRRSPCGTSPNAPPSEWRPRLPAAGPDVLEEDGLAVGTLCRAARCADRCRCGRPGRRRRPAAARRDSWPAPRGGPGLRSCDCRTARRRRRDCPRRCLARPAAAAVRCCRCRSCSRSRRGETASCSR